MTGAGPVQGAGPDQGGQDVGGGHPRPVADPRCTCVTHKRCDYCHRISHAVLSMLSVPARFHGDVNRLADPVLWADQQTSFHDARTALSFARGATVDEVCPRFGYDLRGVA